MSNTEKGVHRFLISLVMSLTSWLVINSLLVKVELWKYFIIEIFLLLMFKLSTYTNQKLGL
jgi:hypothetical protein